MISGDASTRKEEVEGSEDIDANNNGPITEPRGAVSDDERVELDSERGNTDGKRILTPLVMEVWGESDLEGVVLFRFFPFSQVVKLGLKTI